MMRKIQFLVMICAMMCAHSLFAQKEISKRKSPPKQASVELGETTLTVNYGSPSVKGRKVWGKLVPFYKVWRTGANEATTFEVTKDVKIGGKVLKAGKYALFTIPADDEWTIIFNSEPNQWGAYSYDPDKDALRIKVTPSEGNDHVEAMKFEVEDDGKVALKWEKLVVSFNVNEL